MPLYEHVFLARQDVSNTQVEAMTKEYSDLIAEMGGKVTKTEYWGLKSLTYKIKKNRKAHMSLLNIEAPPAAIAEMERRMGIAVDVVRFLTVRVEALETEPSAMMRKSDERSASVVSVVSAATVAALVAVAATVAARAVIAAASAAVVVATVAATARRAATARVARRSARAHRVTVTHRVRRARPVTATPARRLDPWLK